METGTGTTMKEVAVVITTEAGMGTTITDSLRRIWNLYYEGFRGLRLGKTLWKLILLKLLIMFGVFKLFFFNDTLHTKYPTDAERSEHVSHELLKDF